MGVVYEAEDKERGQSVALKTISHLDIEKVYQLKREFRVARRSQSPEPRRALRPRRRRRHLLLHDGAPRRRGLHATPVAQARHAPDRPALGHAMTFRTPDPRALALAVATPQALAQARGTGAGATAIADEATQESSAIPTPCDLLRLRTALPQLARGLQALHAAGKIHRDVKPSNIRVTNDGRVVLLDFGLVAELERRAGTGSGGEPAGLIVGTVAYMAPEQCAGDVPLTPAADWYALGVVRVSRADRAVAVRGRAGARAAREADRRPRRAPSRYAKGIPPDLDDLCAELLEREPTDRPTGPAVLGRLGVTDASSRATTQSISREAGFAGRDAELAQLDAALAAVTADDKRAVGRGRARRRRAWARRRWSRASSSACSATPRTRWCCAAAASIARTCRTRRSTRSIDELSATGGSSCRRRRRRRSCRATPISCRRCSRCSTASPRSPTRRARASVADPQARRTRAFDALRETLQRLGDRRTGRAVPRRHAVGRSRHHRAARRSDARARSAAAPARARDARRRQRAGRRSRAPHGRRASRSSTSGRCPRTSRSRSR